MSITFRSEADIILWTFAKLLITFKERQYLFAAQCIWWIAALVQLDPALTYLIDHQKFPSDIESGKEVRASVQVSFEREISATPRDIQRQSETDEYTVPEQSQYQGDPL